MGPFEQVVAALNSRGVRFAVIEFDQVWSEKRVFRAEGVEVPVARLRHIVESKAAAGRPKDRLFLATHEEALRELLRGE